VQEAQASQALLEHLNGNRQVHEDYLRPGQDCDLMHVRYFTSDGVSATGPPGGPSAMLLPSRAAAMLPTILRQQMTARRKKPEEGDGS
jgi:hypothetical protein